MPLALGLRPLDFFINSCGRTRVEDPLAVTLYCTSLLAPRTTYARLGFAFRRGGRPKSRGRCAKFDEPLRVIVAAARAVRRTAVCYPSTTRALWPTSLNIVSATGWTALYGRYFIVAYDASKLAAAVLTTMRQHWRCPCRLCGSATPRDGFWVHGEGWHGPLREASGGDSTTDGSGLLAQVVRIVYVHVERGSPPPPRTHADFVHTHRPCDYPRGGR